MASNLFLPARRTMYVTSSHEDIPSSSLSTPESSPTNADCRLEEHDLNDVAAEVEVNVEGEDITIGYLTIVISEGTK